MFNTLKTAMQKQFAKMVKTGELLMVDVDKDVMWETYLASFPEGTNPMFRTRTEHDCTCCRQFIKAVGHVVAIEDGKLISIWDVVVDNFYGEVAAKMSEFVREHKISNYFLTDQRIAGTDRSRAVLDGEPISWDHFFFNIPLEFVTNGLSVASRLGDLRTNRDMIQRAFTELTIDAVDTALELIAAGSLPRGDEFKRLVLDFKTEQEKFAKLTDEVAKDVFCWLAAKKNCARIRNTSIGTFLVDLSNGEDFEASLTSYERKVAGDSYKRPKAVATKGMIDKARATVISLGLSSALDRRYANLSDVSINDVLFADRTATTRMADVFEQLSAKASSKADPKTLSGIAEVGIEKFLSDYLPTAETVEVLFEGKHNNNLVSLIAPADATSNRLFKWDNKFSWAYEGDFADSIKARVKAAGGNVTGDVRISLAWENSNDYDLHVRKSNGDEIAYFSRRALGGELDVDANAGAVVPHPVENITWDSIKNLSQGTYKVWVHNFTARTNNDPGFTIEMEIQGKIETFSYDKNFGSGATVEVMTFTVDKDHNITVRAKLPSTSQTRTVWGLETNHFQKVSLISLSPNFWGDNAVGNKHYMFMLDKCIRETPARGFFNEFLRSELDPHRKAFELVGSKMVTDSTEDQLSGLGFSSTQRNELVVRVTGKTVRTVRVKF